MLLNIQDFILRILELMRKNFQKNRTFPIFLKFYYLKLLPSAVGTC